jgi:hypothetical protein
MELQRGKETEKQRIRNINACCMHIWKYKNETNSPIQLVYIHEININLWDKVENSIEFV